MVEDTTQQTQSTQDTTQTDTTQTQQTQAATDDQITLDDLFPETTTTQQTTTTTDDDKGDDATDVMKRVDTKVSTAVNDISQQVARQTSRQMELINFFNTPGNEVYRPYMQQISKVASDPRYIGVKLDRVVGMTLSPQVIMKLGVKLAEQANKDAAANNTGGTGGGANTSVETDKVDFKTMDSKDFEDYKVKAIRGEFLTK